MMNYLSIFIPAKYASDNFLNLNSFFGLNFFPGDLETNFFYDLGNKICHFCFFRMEFEFVKLGKEFY